MKIQVLNFYYLFDPIELKSKLNLLGVNSFFFFFWEISSDGRVESRAETSGGIFPSFILCRVCTRSMKLLGDGREEFGSPRKSRVTGRRYWALVKLLKVPVFTNYFTDYFIYHHHDAHLFIYPAHVFVFGFSAGF